MHKMILIGQFLSRNRPLSRFQQVLRSHLFCFRKWSWNIWLQHFLSPKKQFRIKIFPALAVYVSKTSFWRRIALTGRTYRQNSRKSVRTKKPVFWAKCGVFPIFCRPQLYPMRLIFGYIMSNCQGYQTPKFHVRTFFTSPRYRPKGGRFFVFLLKSGRKFGPKYPGPVLSDSQWKKTFFIYPNFSSLCTVIRVLLS